MQRRIELEARGGGVSDGYRRGKAPLPWVMALLARLLLAEYRQLTVVAGWPLDRQTPGPSVASRASIARLLQAPLGMRQRNCRSLEVCASNFCIMARADVRRSPGDAELVSFASGTSVIGA